MTQEVHTLTADFERALEVGAQVLVNFAPEQTDPVRTSLRGWELSRYLLLDEPDHNPDTVELTPGALWRLKYVAHGNVCVAETRYMEHPSPRGRGVYVTFPEQITVHPLRKHHRATVDLPAQFGPMEAAATLRDTTILDLSLGGCAMLAREELPTGTRLQVLFASTPGQVPIRFLGHVRRCTHSAGGYVLGVEFDDLGAEQRPAVVRLLGTAALRQDILRQDHT